MMDQTTFGARLRAHRERAGKTRPVLGGLVGRSAEWVKALENGRLLPPRLPMLLHLAEVLGLTDLADLTGDQTLPVASVTRAGHPALDNVAAAMQRSPLPVGPATRVEVLRGLVGQAWELWHRSTTERTAVAGVLPGLLSEAQGSARRLDGLARRQALVELARVYHLAQLYLAHQPYPELVWLAADRAMLAAQDADDPAAIAAAGWYYAHVYRGANQIDAAEQVLVDAATLVDPAADDEQLARWGQTQLGIALGHSKGGSSRAGMAGMGRRRRGRRPAWQRVHPPVVDVRTSGLRDIRGHHRNRPVPTGCGGSACRHHGLPGASVVHASGRRPDRGRTGTCAAPR